MAIKKNKIDPETGKEYQIYGLIYGVIAGFWFAAGAWGLDALLLAQAHGDNPALKFLIGAPFVMIIGGIAGWLTARYDRPLLGVLFWLLVGLCYGWFVSHVPFDWLTLALGYLDRNFTGIDIYPFVFSAQMRMFLLMTLLGVILAFLGGFELFFTEAAARTTSRFAGILKLLACFVIFIPSGLIADNLINSPLRASTTGLHQTIQLAREARGTGLSLDTKRASGIRVLDMFGEQIENPYKITLGTYNMESLQETTAFVNFSGSWGLCPAVEGKAIVCWNFVERYLRKLDCIVNGGSFTDCGLKKEEKAKASNISALETLDQTALTYGVIGARGTTVLVLAEDHQGHQVECRLRDVGDIYLQSCSLSRIKTFNPIHVPPTATRRVPTATPAGPVPTATRSLPISSSGNVDQGAALLDPSQLSLPSLKGAPIYSISLDLADDLLSFHGGSQIEVTNNETVTLDSLYFHLLPNGKSSYGDGSITVDKVVVDGKDTQGELSNGNTVIKVPLMSPLNPDESALIDFRFQGKIPRDFGSTATPDGYGIYNYSDRVLAMAGWYPILSVYDENGWHLEPPSWLGDSVYSDISFYTVDVTLPKSLLVAATGVTVKDDFVGDARKIRYVSGPVREFFITASDTFHVVKKEIDGTTINSYFQTDEPEAGRKALSIAAASLSVYNSRFGRYPYKELDVVAGPMRNALGVEFPGIVMISADLYTKADDPGFEITVAHEVAHQWWYNVVGNDVFREPWLDEAFATYSSGLYYEQVNGSRYLQGLVDYWNQGYQELASRGKDDLVTETLAHFEDLKDPSIYGGIVYRKGALFLQALRQEIGEKAFFEAIRRYYHDRQFGLARSTDLLSAFELASGQDLQTFFDEWLYSKIDLTQ